MECLSLKYKMYHKDKHDESEDPDEDVEDVAVEDGADETNENVVRPQPGFELPLLLLAGIRN